MVSVHHVMPHTFLLNNNKLRKTASTEIAFNVDSGLILDGIMPAFPGFH